MHSAVTHVCTALALNKALLKGVRTCWGRLGKSTENRNVCVLVLKSASYYKANPFWLIFSTSKDCFWVEGQAFSCEGMANVLYWMEVQQCVCE